MKLIPFGQAYINPDHVVSVAPERTTPDGVHIVLVHFTSGPVMTYEVADAPSMLHAVNRLATHINDHREDA